MQKILELPESAKLVISEYFNLPIGGKKIKSPYFMNIRKQRAGLRVLVGKGKAEEIVREVQVLAKVKKINLNELSDDQIRKFMISQDLGVDCSGFVTHILNFWLHQTGKKPLIHYLQFPDNSLIKKLKCKLRPVENIGANLLTGNLNCDKITDLNDIKPGDLVRLKGRQKNSHHVMIVSKVTLEDNVIKSFEYTESTRDYGDDNGIRIGTVIITNPDGELKDQNWTDIDPQTNRNWTHENLLKEYDDNGIRRLKNVELIFGI